MNTSEQAAQQQQQRQAQQRTSQQQQAHAQQQQKNPSQPDKPPQQQPKPALAESIQNIAIQMGLVLTPECAYSMAPNVEYHLREVIQEACKFMRHSRRGTLSTRDVNYALRTMGIEQLYGFFSSEPLRFEKVPGSKGGLYAVHDPIINLDDLINQPLPACPREPTLGAHWMAIEGVQPAIPENPSAVAASAANAAAVLRGQTGQSEKATAPAAASAAAAAAATAGEGTGEPSVKVVPLVRQVLSKELQLYYDSVTDAILNGSEVQRDASFSSLAGDAGLHLLVPYFTLFVSDKVRAARPDSIRSVCI